MRSDLKTLIDRIPVRQADTSPISVAEPRPRGYESATIDQVPVSQRAKIREACKSGRWPLLLTGTVGTGKTCAAACVYGSFAHLPMWYRADDLLISMSLGRSGTVRAETLNEFGEVVTTELPYSKFVGRVANRSAVFLDDLGTRQPTESTYQALFDLLEWRKGRPLIITSNKRLSELAGIYDDRIADRLKVGTVVAFSGDSRRQKGQS